MGVYWLLFEVGLIFQAGLPVGSLLVYWLLFEAGLIFQAGLTVGTLLVYWLLFEAGLIFQAGLTVGVYWLLFRSWLNMGGCNLIFQGRAYCSEAAGLLQC